MTQTQELRPQAIAVEENILDGAEGEGAAVFREMSDLRKIVVDVDNPLETRLEAYEDIIDSEVGDTHMARVRNIEREIGIRQLYLKFEGGNPTGTQKDRIAFAQVMDALRRGFDTITVATCGNYGAAVALAASLAGMRCIIYIPERYHTQRIKEMKHYGPEIMRCSGDYENAVACSQSEARKNEYYDANPGGDNTSIQLKAYGEIANEIYDELRDAPHAIAIPVSNGTTCAGIYRGFLSLFRRGKTSRMPKIIVGSSHRKNPIIRAFQKKLAVCEDLKPSGIRETQINEPLINWHSIDGDFALSAIRQTGGAAVDASDRKMRQFSRLIREKEGMQVLPASTAGLIAMETVHRQGVLPSDRYVAILTGRKT